MKYMLLSRFGSICMDGILLINFIFVNVKNKIAPTEALAVLFRETDIDVEANLLVAA